MMLLGCKSSIRTYLGEAMHKVSGIPSILLADRLERMLGAALSEMFAELEQESDETRA
jgi:hypothetical protein